MMTIVYKLGNALYLNITNACPCSCVFCIRNLTDGVGSAASLWLEHEPSLDEIKTAIDAHRPFSGIDEIVFCGFGEPMERADIVIAVSEYIKSFNSSFFIGQEKPAQVRLNTNGLVFLMWPGFDVSRLAVIDAVSISLNADDPAEYLRLTQSKFGEGSFDSMLAFAREAMKYTSVVFSVVDGNLSDDRLINCQKIAGEIGVPLRVRGRE